MLASAALDLLLSGDALKPVQARLLTLWTAYRSMGC